MNSRCIQSRLATISKGIVIAAVVFAVTLPARAQKRGDDPPASQNNSAGLSSGVVSLLPGQSVRLAAINVGNKDIPLELVVIPVSDQGKALVPIRCNAIVSSGNAAFEKFTHPGGVNRLLFYAQVRVRQNVKDLDNLVPSLEVFDEQAGLGGGPHFVLSGADFVSIGPIFNPPLPPPEN